MCGIICNVSPYRNGGNGHHLYVSGQLAGMWLFVAPLVAFPDDGWNRHIQCMFLISHSCHLIAHLVL